MKHSTKNDPAGLLGFLLFYARHYLSAGGPTSRLEDSIMQLGKQFGHETEVFATPTGVFITSTQKNEKPETALVRIKSTSINLGKLCILERVYNDISSEKISIKTALETLRSGILSKPFYKIWQTALAAFITGFVICYDSYRKISVAAVSGIIALAIWLITAVLLPRKISNPIFGDFAGTFLTLVFAAFANHLMPTSIEAYSLGAIVLLVPGLALTTAIAELAEQNLVSGTAKFMQAFLTILAIGLAYLIFQELASSLDIGYLVASYEPKQKEFLISLFAVIMNASCFGVILKVPPKSIFWVMLTGVMGWICFHILATSQAAIAAPYLASVLVGMLSLLWGRIFRLPSQVYSVPGIVAMLPGMLAISSFRLFASGDQESGIELSLKVAITTVSIVFGLITARIPFSNQSTTLATKNYI